MVYRAGERDLPLTVVLRGDVEVYEEREGTVQILATPGPRDWRELQACKILQRAS